MELSSTAKVILGMVAYGRTTGYDIKQLVDKSTRNFWAASYGQIYPELRRLEDAGLLVGKDDPAGGRARRSYRLTRSGERALRSWLTSSEDTVYELRDEWILKLFFGDSMKPGEVLALVRAKRAFHEDRARRLRAIEPRAEASGARHPLIVLRQGIALHEWTADQMKSLEKDLEA